MSSKNDKPPLSRGGQEVQTLLHFETFLQHFVRQQDPPPLRLLGKDLERIRLMKKAARRYEERTGEPFSLTFDMGRVLVMRGRVRGKRLVNTSREVYHKEKPRDGMLRLVRCFSAALGKERVFLLKGLPDPKQEPGVEAVVRYQAQMWLEFRHFFGLADFSRDNLLFAERGRKLDVCLERRIHGIVDDRGEVLQNFPPNMLVLAFCPVPEEWERYPEARKRARVVRSGKELWQAVQNYLEK